MIAGVCNGSGRYFNMDPTVVRLIFVALLVLSTGFFAIAVPRAHARRTDGAAG